MWRMVNNKIVCGELPGDGNLIYVSIRDIEIGQLMGYLIKFHPTLTT